MTVLVEMKGMSVFVWGSVFEDFGLRVCVWSLCVIIYV